MRHQTSLIDRLRVELHQLNRADRAVADVVLDDIEAATRISIKDLSSRAQVSEPTVIRFSRRMGCDGFSDFKIRLAQDYAIGQMYITAERTTPAETGNDVADQVYEATTQASPGLCRKLHGNVVWSMKALSFQGAVDVQWPSL